MSGKSARLVRVGWSDMRGVDVTGHVGYVEGEIGLRKQSEPQETDEEEEEILRRSVRRALRSLRLPALRALLRVIRYAEEGKTPMAVAAEDLTEGYKVEAIFAQAARLRAKKAISRARQYGDER